MKKILAIVILGLICYGQPLWAGDKVIDTLRATDEQQGSWILTGCSVEEDCVDDPVGSPDDWSTYLYYAVSGSQQIFQWESTSLTVDSMAMYARCWLTGGGNQKDTLYLGWARYSEATWQWSATDDLLVYVDATIVTYRHKMPTTWTPDSLDAVRVGVLTGDVLESGEVEYLTSIYIFVYGEEGAPPAAGKQRERRIRNLKEEADD